jgi:hypothetical protein
VTWCRVQNRAQRGGMVRLLNARVITSRWYASRVTPTVIAAKIVRQVSEFWHTEAMHHQRRRTESSGGSSS